MTNNRSSEMAPILGTIAAGDEAAQGTLFEVGYDELRVLKDGRLARAWLRHRVGEND
jgi:hypothetical protein